MWEGSLAFPRCQGCSGAGTACTSLLPRLGLRGLGIIAHLLLSPVAVSQPYLCGFGIGACRGVTAPSTTAETWICLEMG